MYCTYVQYVCTVAEADTEYLVCGIGPSAADTTNIAPSICFRKKKIVDCGCLDGGATDWRKLIKTCAAPVIMFFT